MTALRKAVMRAMQVLVGLAKLALSKRTRFEAVAKQQK
jgi:hypothetical protein